MAYWDFKDLNRITDADNVLRDKSFDLSRNTLIQNMVHNNVDLLQWFINFLIKIPLVALLTMFLIKN